ncbi:hypothetical protein DFP90_10630 [Aestuariispira insulae]|uniref:Uncharacterized protein n=1 Tax=Aestuariispira insulae TaxID=1461337 RepID=A0A3D9HHX1_9PROT|nr:hypothetical protein DFP90_10630 [Aestuariispira insulae]
MPQPKSPNNRRHVFVDDGNYDGMMKRVNMKRIIFLKRFIFEPFQGGIAARLFSNYLHNSVTIRYIMGLADKGKKS